MKKFILGGILCLLLTSGFSQSRPAFFRINNGSCGEGTSELDLYFSGGCPFITPYPLIDAVYYQGEKIDVDFLIPDGSNCELHNYLRYCISRGELPASDMLTIYVNYGDGTGGIIASDVIAGGTLPPIVTNIWTGRVSNYVTTQWVTTQEVDILNFQLQRSFDNVNFQNVATFDSRGSANTTTTYAYTDDNNYSKRLSFYRIQINDIHGGFSYSYIKDVPGMNMSEEIGLYPNPARGSSLINLSQYYTDGTVEIFDNGGRRMQTAILKNNGSFQLHNLQKGMYVVRITDKVANEVLIKKIIITD